MSQQTAALVEATVRQQCKSLYLSTVGSQFARLAGEAVKARQSHTEYLEALLAAELEERERRQVERRIHEAHLPKVKTLEDFDFAQASTISAAQIRELAEGGYIDRAEPVVLTGDCGTGKTHLATALCVAACRQRRRVRFTTATALVMCVIRARKTPAIVAFSSRNIDTASMTPQALSSSSIALAMPMAPWRARRSFAMDKWFSTARAART